MLLQYLARLALDNNISRAQTAGAAISYFWKTKFGLDPALDTGYASFLRGLRSLRPLLSSPQPRRNELPVHAIAHFYSSPPASLDADTHSLICAALVYGMRAIQRGGQIADLECCDISTLNLLPSAGVNVSAAGLALRAVVRTSKTDQNGARPYDVVIDRGVTTLDPIRLIDDYVRRRYAIPLTDWNQSRFARSREKFFTSRQGPISTASLRSWVRLVASHAGLQGYYGSHSLRIAGACWAVLGGLSLETIMAIGGWTSQSSTAIYLRSLIAAVGGASARMGF